LQGLKVPEAAGKRFSISAECLWYRDIAETLNKQYGKWWTIDAGEPINDKHYELSNERS